MFYHKFIFISIFLLVSCVSGNTPSQPSQHGAWTQDVASSHIDIVVRLCQSMSDLELLTLMKNYAIQVERKVSPTIIVVGWRDDRTTQEVLDKLQKSGKFCGVQENFQVQMIKNKK